MRTIEAASSALPMVDFQPRVMPAIADRDAVPVLFTEQSPAKLGNTVPDLAPATPSLPKTCFDAGRDPAFEAALPDRATVLLAGVEAHVCVPQTAPGLLDGGRRVVVVGDAVGSRAPASRVAALRRTERHGVEVVTAEMAIFEWLGAPATRASPT